MLDHVTVEAYGETQPLTALAQIALKNAQLIMVNPFDSSVRRERWAVRSRAPASLAPPRACAAALALFRTLCAMHAPPPRAAVLPSRHHVQSIA
jgi:hypothetical protein